MNVKCSVLFTFGIKPWINQAVLIHHTGLLTINNSRGSMQGVLNLYSMSCATFPHMARNKNI